jgi:hypothetical protein
VRDDLRAAVVPVETELGDHHAGGSLRSSGRAHSAGSWKTPNTSLRTPTISPSVASAART